MGLGRHLAKEAALPSLIIRTTGASLVLTLAAGAAQAVPDWRKDGRLGYATRAEAVSIANAFTAPGAPREGMGFVIHRDPDGGFTPVFQEKALKGGPGV